jgi:hypothetical protein
MPNLSDAELGQESKHYMTQFIGRVFAGAVYQREGHLYAIESPFRPNQQSWQPTSTVPQTMAHRAEDLTRRIQSGDVVADLPTLRRDFDEIRAGLEQVKIYLALTPESLRPQFVLENVESSLPAVKRFVLEAEKKLNPAPAHP